MERTDDNVKNIYVIKQNLSNLKRTKYGDFKYAVGNRFLLTIFTNRIQEPPSSGIYDRITHHKTVDVVVDEYNNRNGTSDRIHLNHDSRFKDYEPIKYENSWNGEGMPILQLCELIKYLHRLNNLSAFA